MSGFLILSFAEKEEENFVPMWIKRLSNAWYKNYLLKNMPVKQMEVTRYGEDGQKILLPFTVEESEKYGKEYVTSFINHWMKKHEIDACYIEKGDRPYFDYVYQDNSWILNYILFPQIIERVVKQYQLKYQNLYLVILDSGDKKIEYILEFIVLKLNHLTIITERAEYFTEFAELLYKNMGLVVEIMVPPFNEKIKGKLVIDCGLNNGKGYKFFEKDAIVIDLNSNKEKLHYLTQRRGDMKIIYDVSAKMNQEVIEKEFVSYFLSLRFWKLTQLERGNVYYQETIKEIVEQYKIQLLDLKVL